MLFVIGKCQGSEYAIDTQGSEYAWACSWKCSNMPEAEHKITLQAE